MVKTVKQAIRIIIAKTGLSRDGIAERIGRNPSYLSTAQKHPTMAIIELLKEEFAKELAGVTIVLNPHTLKVVKGTGKELGELKMKSMEVQALVNVLLPVVSDIYAKVEGIEFSESYDMLRSMLEDEFDNLKKSLVEGDV